MEARKPPTYSAHNDTVYMYAFMPRVSFSVASGTFSALDMVESVTLVFESLSSDATGATVEYLVVGHKLAT